MNVQGTGWGTWWHPEWQPLPVRPGPRWGPSTLRVNGDLGLQSPEGADVLLGPPKVKLSFERRTFPLRPGRRHANANLVARPSLVKEAWWSRLCEGSRGAYAPLPWYRPCPRGRVPAAVSPPPCRGHRRHRPTALKAAVLFLPVVRELAFLTVFWVSSGRHPWTPSDSEAPSPGEASH